MCYDRTQSGAGQCAPVKGEIRGMKMNQNRLYTIIAASLMIALVCVMTMVVRIPTPTKGYLNLGDCFVLLSGWLLGPLYGFLAGGIGSGLADLLSGYPVYVPGTLIIKGLMALAFAWLYHTRSARKEGALSFGWFLGAVIAEAIMIAGYYLYEAIFMGEGFAGALLGVSGNAMQGIVGAVCACLLTQAIAHTGIYAKFGYHKSK